MEILEFVNEVMMCEGEEGKIKKKRKRKVFWMRRKEKREGNIELEGLDIVEIEELCEVKKKGGWDSLNEIYK